MAEQIETKTEQEFVPNPYSPEEIVQPAPSVDETTAYSAEEQEKEKAPKKFESVEPVKQVQDEKPDTVKDDTTGDFFQKSTDSKQGGNADDKLQSADYYWDNNQDLRNKFELEFPGKGREKYDEYYKTIADKYFNKVVSYTDNLQLNSIGMGEEYYRNGKQVITDPSSMAPIGGGFSLGGKVIGQSRSVRQAEIDSKNLLTDDSKFVKVEDNWSDVIGNPKYKSKDGRLITALEYIPYDPSDRTEGGLKAVYEGERSKGETVSVHDMNGWITSNVGMETPWSYVIPKAVVRSTVNTVASLASSSVDLLNATATLFDADDDNDTIRATNNLRNKLKSYEISTADYDQQHMMTFANGINLVTDVAAQLVLAGGIGRVAGGLAKVSQAAGAAASKWGTIAALSLMGASDIRDEALNAGFSEDAAASLFLAYLPAMAAANSISEVMINEESAPFIKAEIKRLAAESLQLTTPEKLANDASRWAFAKTVANKMSGGLAKLSETMSQNTASKAAVMGMAAASEATEEVVEQIFGDALKTGANVISKYTSNKDDYPKMVGMYDAEYWEKAPAELLMNAVGGALGGPMGKLIMGHHGIQSLPYQTSDKDKILRLAIEGGESWNLYKESLLHARDKGLLGTDKYSYKMDADKKFVRLDDLSPAERANHLSIAEANYRLKMMQANLYESILGGFKGTYDDFVKKNPGLAEQMVDRGAAYERAGNIYKELEGLYKEIAPENYKAAEEVKKGWFKRTTPRNATHEAAAATANTTANTDENNAQVTTSEKNEVSTQEPDTQITQDIRDYADKLGVDPIKAKKILDKEQELADMLSGKTMERDYIDMVIASDPITFGPLKETKDLLFSGSGDDFLQKLTEADVNRFTKTQQDHATYLAKKAEFETQVDNLNTTEDLTKLLDSTAATNGNLYLSPEKRELLKSKMHTVIGSSFTDADVTAIHSILDNDLEINKMIASSSVVEKGTEKETSIASRIGQAKDLLESDGMIGNEILLPLVEDNIAVLYNYAKSAMIKSYMDKGKEGLFNILTMKNGTNLNEFRDTLLSVIQQSDPTNDPINDILDAFIEFNDKATNKVDLISTDNELKASISKYTDLIDTATKKASEESFESAGDFAETFLKPISTTDDNVEVGKEDMRSSIQKLFARMQPTVETDDDIELLKTMFGHETELSLPEGTERQEAWNKLFGKALFDATEDAKSLLASVKARQAQLDLLLRLGDPRNVLKSTTDKLLATSKTLSTLRKHNAKVMSPEEFGAGLNNTKYSKYSKVISGWLFDPVKAVELATKPVLSDVDKQQLNEIERRFAHVMVARELLSTAEADLNTLISFGEASKDETTVANKFKGSVKEYVVNKDEGLTIRLNKLLNVVDDTELKSKVMDLVTFAPSVSPENDEQIKELYSKIIDVASSLYKIPREQKLKVMDQIGSSRDLRNNADIVAFMNSDINEFYKHFKDTISIMKQKGSDIIMPSMEQELVAMQVFSYVTVPTKDNLIKDKIKSFKGAERGKSNMIFVPGGYGTGKTKIVAGYAAKTIQLYFREKYKGQNTILFGANNPDQIENLVDSAKSYGVVLTDGATGRGFTQKDLLDIFESQATDPIEAAHNKLKSTSLIVFDEATMIEDYTGDASTPPALLKLIANSIDEINLKRVAEGLPELVFIGLGDRYQGGWKAGDKTVRGFTVSTGTSESVPYNISSSDDVFNTSPLTVNFRSFVTAIDQFAKSAVDVHKVSMGRQFKANPISEIRTQFGPLINDETGKMGGVQVVNSRAALYSDIAEDIRKQLEADPNFRVLIVDDGIKSIGDMEEGDLKELMKEYPDAFKLEGLAGVSNIRVRTIEDAQGSEANYVIINTPSDWLPKITSPEGNGYRYSMVSMLAGRARHFVKLRVDPTVNIKSNGPVQVPSIQQSTGEFMKAWTDFKLSVLDGITTGTTEAQPGNVETAYVTGETVTVQSVDGSNQETAKIHAVDDNGDVSVTTEDNPTPRVVGNISNPETAITVQRQQVNTPTKAEPDKNLVQEAKKTREGAYDAYTKNKGTLATFDGKPCKIITYQKTNDLVEVKFDDGTTSKLKISEVFGKNLTVNTIEASFKTNIDAAEKVTKKEQAKEPDATQKSLFEDDIELEPEDDIQPEESDLTEYLLDGDKFDPISDTNEAKDVMTQLEKKGVVVAYQDISKEFDKGTFNTSLRYKVYYSNDNFNGNIANEAELLELMNRASGYRGKDETLNFNYSLATYEYYTPREAGKAKQTRYFGNAIVATEIKTGKKFILGMFATSKLGEGKFKQFLTQREDALKRIAESYLEADADTQYDFGVHTNETPGSVVYEAKNVLPKKNVVSIAMAEKNKVPLVMETDITNDFIDNVLVGTTPGVLVRSSADIASIMSKMDSSVSWNREVIKSMETGSRVDKYGKPVKRKPIDLGKSQITDNTVGKLPSNFRTFKGNIVAKYKEYFIVTPKLEDRISIPLVTKDGNEFNLLCGFTKDGDPIIGNLIPDDKMHLFEVVGEYKKAIEKLGLDTNMKKVQSYDNDLHNLRREIATALKYDLEGFDSSTSILDKFNYAVNPLTQLAVTHLADVPITLAELKKLVNFSGDPKSANVRSNLKFSKPMVLRQSNKTKDGLTAGRIFVLYSSNGKYDVSDPKVVKDLENELMTYMKNAGKNDINGAIGYLRGGVGIITLDYPHMSFSQLAKIRRQSEKGYLNRYATPSDSEVGRRLIAMFSEFSKLVNAEGQDIDGQDRLPKNYSRLNSLLNANVDKNGNKISVLKKNVDVFVTDLAKKLKDSNYSDPVITHFLNVIDTITKDENLGNYVTTMEGGSLADAVTKHKYPTNKIDGATYKFVPGASGKPKVFEINQNPLIYIPKEIATELGYSGVSEPLKFNLESLFRLIEEGGDSTVKPTREQIEGVYALLDSLMLNHTEGLNKGIKVPPAMMKTDKTRLWGVLEEPNNISLENMLTTPVKDVRTAALAMNLDNLIGAVEKATSAGKPKGSTPNQTEAKQQLNNELEAVYTAVLDTLAKSKLVDETISNAILKNATSSLLAITEKWKTKGIISPNIINTLYANVFGKISSTINSKVVQTEYPISDIRQNTFARPDIKKLAGMGLKYNFDYNTVNRIFNDLSWVVDEKTLGDLRNEMNGILSKISDKTEKKYVKNYFDAVVNSFNKPDVRINTRSSIDELVNLHDTGKINISKLDVSTDEVINSLENLTDPEVFNPYRKSTLLKAYVHGNEDQRTKLEDYIFSDPTNMNEPTIVAYALYESVVGGYPLNEGSESVTMLSRKAPQLLGAVMASPKVQQALSELVDQDWMSNFNSEIETVINAQVDVDTKHQYLNALSIVIDNLRPTLNENVIKTMEELLETARLQVSKVPSGGKGQDLLSIFEGSPFFSELEGDTKSVYKAAILKAQEELGESMQVILDVLSKQASIENPDVARRFGESNALLMDALYDNLNSPSDFKTLSYTLAKLFASIC